VWCQWHCFDVREVVFEKLTSASRLSAAWAQIVLTRSEANYQCCSPRVVPRQRLAAFTVPVIWVTATGLWLPPSD
jgi:hypothetical protein